MQVPDRGSDRGSRAARLLAHARFLGAWGHLLAAGASEATALGALDDDATDPDLRELARAVAGAGAQGTGAALDAHGGCLDAWVTALLAGPRRPEHLIAAGALLEREARGDDPPRAALWRKLALLAAAQAALGDALSTLAREARDREQGALAEGLYGAARRARGGAGLLESLRGLTGLTGLERAALEAAQGGAEPAPLLATLEALARLPGSEAPPPVGAAAAPPTTGSSLTNLAQAATAGAAPLRRGIERVLSGIEEALGIGPPPAPDTAAATPAQLAREAMQARAARASASERLAPAPAAPPVATATAAIGAADAPAAPAAGKKKTIGMDSGPVPLPGYDAGKGLVGEAARLDVGRPPADPVEAWTRSLERVRSKLTVAELTPGEEGPGLVREAEAELRRLRETLPGGERSRRLAAQLDDLELRLLAWREKHGGA